MARPNNSIVPGGGNAIQKGEKFSVVIQSDTMQKMILKSVPDAKSAARLTGSLISLVASNTELQNCSPASIVAAALRGEGMGLMLGFGYYVVPYAGTAQFQSSYKGLIAMAMAGGDVADMDCVEVREGEYSGRNRRTKRPEFNFALYETDAEAEQHPIIGYYAYIEKRDGFFRSEYMSVGAILDHAEQYSKTFDRAKYRQLISGDMSPEEVEKLRKKSPWYSSTETMMKKTVIRRLLNSGYVQLQAIGTIKAIMEDEDAAISDAEAIASFDVMDVDPGTGEIITQSTQSVPGAAESAEKSDGVPAQPEKKSSAGGGRKRGDAKTEAKDAEYTEIKPVNIQADEDEDAVLGGFFG